MKKIKTIYPGVRYRENPTRKYQGKPDKYFFIRYQDASGKEKEEPAGWASENSLNATKVNEIRAELIHNIRMGLHPQSLAEKREIEQAEKIRIESEKSHAEEQARQEEKQNITFGDAAGSFLNWSEANKKTFRDDQHRYKHRLEKPLSRVRLKDVSSAYIDTLKAGWMKKVSPKTVDHYLSLIHCVFEHAINSLEIQIENPVKKVKRPEYDNRKTRFFSHDQAAALLEKLDKSNTQTVHDQAIFGLYAGLRFGEIIRLKWTDINLETGLIEIRNTKTALNRQAYITEPIREMLERRLSNPKRDPVYVFKGRQGKTQKHVSGTFYRAVAELGFNDGRKDRADRLDFHSTRHSFGSWLAQEGVSLYEISELMGHQDISQTRRYAKLLPETKRRAVESLARAAAAGRSAEVIPLDATNNKRPAEGV